MQNLTSIPARYLPSPFWSWNDELEPEELRRQIREMHRASLGGFFMHARSGLRTEYMGSKWMDCVKACLDEAAKLGMDAWLYDENGWPSGFASGAVNRKGDAFRQKYLRCHTLAAEEACPSQETLCFYSLDGRIRYGKTVPTRITGKVLEFHYEINPFYVDNLDAKVVAEFLSCTHQRYAETLSKTEMAAIRGVFTDEPQLSRNGHPWSFILQEEYFREYSLDLLDDLAKLFLDIPGAPQARIRFWGLCAKLFSVNFLKQIADWCEAHDWQLTGHHVMEESYLSQLTSNGAIMPQYQYYHIPGIDHLSRIEPDLINMKQVTSVAAQTGKEQVLSETFALTGWNLNMKGMKWLFQQQLAHGINYLCQHLAAYSMRGMRKRDYPLASSWQVPWWDEYHLLNECFGRVGMLMATGTIMTDILVLHGQSTAWALYNDTKKAKTIILKYTSSLSSLSEALDGCKASYHYADESMLCSQGSWKNGVLRLGKMTYQAVLLPQLANLSKEAFQMIAAMLAAGKPVYAVRNQLLPGILLIDGIAATPEQWLLYNKICWFDNEAAAAHAVAKLFPRSVILEHQEEATQIVAEKRYFDDLCGRKGTLYFLVNRRPEAECRANVQLPGAGTVECLGMFDGRFSTVPSEFSSSHRCFQWDFAPAGAALFFINDADSTPPQSFPAAPQILRSRVVPVVSVTSEGWRMVQSTPNILTLDQCEYKVDNGEWISDDVSVIQDRLLKLQRACTLVMRFRFCCGDGFNEPLQLGVETPEIYVFSLNGKTFQPEVQGYLFDRSIKTVGLPPIRAGENILELSLHYWQAPSVYQMLERARKFETEFNMRTFDTEVESVYLLGAFGVSGGFVTPIMETAPPIFDSGTRFSPNPAIPTELWHPPFTLLPAPQTIDISDLTGSGFPFFAGKLTASREFQLTSEETARCRILALPFLGLNSVRAVLNGRELGILFWEPATLTIPKNLLREGNNTLSLELTTSLRNMLGPHHPVGGDLASVSPLSFQKEPNVIDWEGPEYQPNYCLVRQAVTQIFLGE
ncbi:MAG: hypothetical protein WCT05_08995 [Lentisphaeria bacterium]